MRRHGGPERAALRGSVVLVLAAAALFSACAKGQRPPAAPVNVLLITVDTLRPDALGWVSGARETPAIDRLAREGFRFPAAVAPVPLTLPSHAAMLTGLSPRRLGLRENGQLLGAQPQTLAGQLGGSGYATAAFVSGYPLDSAFGLDRGFAHYDDRFTAQSGGDLERPARTTTQAAAAWLRSARQPWLAWVHYYDPHYPYEPPEELRRPGPRGAYDGEVAAVDRAVGELLRSFEVTRERRVLTVFAGDHGESLAEHGEGTHGFFIYDSTILVPLIFHFPGEVSPGQSRAGARLVDLAPTVLELLGGAPLPETDGVSLRPMFRGEDVAIPPATIETYQPWISYGWAPLRGLRHAGWKLVMAPRPELYHLSSDPREERNLAQTHEDKLRELERLRVQQQERPAVGSAGPASDPEAVAKLRALGYLGGGSAMQDPPPRGLRDPKDSRRLRDALTQADESLRRGDARSAVPLFAEVLKEDPGNRFALFRSGAALSKLGDHEQAIARLRRAAKLVPDQPEIRATLADALARAGRFAEAAEEGMETVRLQPRRAQAWASLGTTLGLAGRIPQAVEALRRAVELEPTDPAVRARLAFAEHAAGHAGEAARQLREVARLAGENRFPYSGALGILLRQLGQTEEARRYLARSRPEEADYAQARLELALLEAERGDLAAARRALREALSVAPGLASKARADRRLALLLP